MRVVGIDPGIEITGFALIEVEGAKQELIECGVIRTPSTSTTVERLIMIENDLSELLKRFGDVDVAGVEELFFAKNVTSAFQVGQARGVVLLLLGQAGIPIIELKPSTVKAAVTGNGRADKKEMQRMIQLQFNLPEPPQPDDAADAVGVAMTAAAHFRNQ